MVSIIGDVPDMARCDLRVHISEYEVVLGYVAGAGVLAQLSIQAIEDPNTPKEMYT